MDINKVWISGLAVSQPIITRVPGIRAQLAYFTMQVNERYHTPEKQVRVHVNFVRVEGLGRAAEQIMEKVRPGVRYMIDGYLRHDSKEWGDEFKVRIFAIYRDESDETVLYKDGLKAALRVLKRSADIGAASKELESLLKEDEQIGPERPS